MQKSTASQLLPILETNLCQRQPLRQWIFWGCLRSAQIRRFLVRSSPNVPATVQRATTTVNNETVKPVATDKPVEWRVSVCYADAPYKNGSTDRGPVRGKSSWGPKEHCVKWWSDFPTERGRKGAILPAVLWEAKGERGFDAAITKLLWPLVYSVENFKN